MPITRDNLVAALRVVASVQGHPSYVHLGHVEPGPFARLRDFFPEAAIVDVPGSPTYSHLTLDLPGFWIHAQTAPEALNPSVEGRSWASEMKALRGEK
jgi:hypothetical protein